MAAVSWQAPTGDGYQQWVRRAREKRFVVALDCGKLSDPSAISVIEALSLPDIKEGQRVEDVDKVRLKTRVHVRHLQRLPLNLDYTQQADCVLRLTQRYPLRGDADFVLDQTGLGGPIKDIFKRAGLKPIGITLTAGFEVGGTRFDRKIPKLLLISRLQSLLHTGDLLISDRLPEAQALIEELRDFEYSYTDSGYTRFNAKQGSHDDLLISVALGAWVATDRRSVRTTKMLSGHF